MFNVDYITEIIPKREVFENLILPEGRTDFIKALVESHVQKSPDDISGDKTYQLYSADAIRGKGQGLLVLLHGAPGTGKTSTAECVAEVCPPVLGSNVAHIIPVHNETVISHHMRRYRH
jgi:predicted ATPase with chaperone activity